MLAFMSFLSLQILDGSIIEYELRTNLNQLMPWIEYIVRCDWMAHGQRYVYISCRLFVIFVKEELTYSK